jgi:hypothetical protein
MALPPRCSAHGSCSMTLHCLSPHAGALRQAKKDLAEVTKHKTTTIDEKIRSRLDEKVCCLLLNVLHRAIIPVNSPDSVCYDSQGTCVLVQAACT